MNTLDKKINKIKKIFDVNELINADIDDKYISKYYSINKIPYTILHSKSNFIHMAISRDGKYKDDDLKEPARFVDKYIHERKAKSILELATGRGANSTYLALKNKEISFTGIDIADSQLSFAKNLNNLKFLKQNYHDLSKFGDESFDIVFIVEAICYSNDFPKVFKEVSRVLKDNGLFIVFDGFLKKRFDLLTKNELLAKQLTERGMACKNIKTYKELVNSGLSNNFKIEFQEDVSEFILPNLRKFERLSNIFYKFTFLAKLIRRLLPKKFVYNSFSGYLMQDLITQDIASYNIIVFEKG